MIGDENGDTTSPPHAGSIGAAPVTGLVSANQMGTVLAGSAAGQSAAGLAVGGAGTNGEAGMPLTSFDLVLIAAVIGIVIFLLVLVRGG